MMPGVSLVAMIRGVVDAYSNSRAPKGIYRVNLSRSSWSNKLSVYSKEQVRKPATFNAFHSHIQIKSIPQSWKISSGWYRERRLYYGDVFSPYLGASSPYGSSTKIKSQTAAVMIDEDYPRSQRRYAKLLAKNVQKGDS